MKSTLKTVLIALTVGTSLTASAIGNQISTSPRRQVDKSATAARIVSKMRTNSTNPLKLSDIKQLPKSQGKSLTVDASKPTLYGSIIYSDSWANLDTEPPYGVYSFQPTSPISFSEICIHPNLYINGGGCYSDHRLHYRLWAFSDDYSTFYNYYVVLNTDDWSYAQDPILTNVDETIAFDMTYDPIGKTLYSIAWGPYDSGKCDFCRVDMATGETSKISTLPEMACIAANNFGEIFAVSITDGILYKLDKTTGEATRIGATGLSPKYSQSATVDPETNIIYWAETNSDDTAALYTLNTTTGAAERVSAMPASEEITALFIEAPTRGLDAPAALSNVILSYQAGTSTIDFRAPQTAFDGTALTGNITTKIYIDGVLANEESVAPGANVSFSAIVAAGEHTIVAFAENSVGCGPKEVRTQWAGNDAPAAVGNLLLEIADGVATLTWDAPAQGLHGGMVDRESLRYKVVRYPDATTVATDLTETTFTETLPAGIANYYYTVTATTADGEGGTATSNSCFTGTAFTLPYFEPFDTENAVLGYTIVDANKDGNTWAWKTNWQAMACRFSKESVADDWLITPPIEYKSTSSYRLTFKARAFDSESPERFEVALGTTTSPSDLRTTLIPTKSITDDNFETFTADFTVPADGIYHIGIHCTSPIDNYYLIVDDIKIEEKANANCPATVTDLTATAGDAGSLSATISFTAPTKTYGGAELTSLKAINIYKGEGVVPAQTFANPAPGAKLSWTDTNASEGTNTYRVAAVNEAGSGIESQVSVWVGYDTPRPVTNLTVREQDGNAVLSWTAPTTGVNGAKLDPSKLTYTIVRVGETTAAEGLTATTFTDTEYASTTTQIFMYYGVKAVYGDCESEFALSDYVILGPDDAVPFAESFANQSLDNAPWALSYVQGTRDIAGWTLTNAGTHPDVTAQDNDSGFATFNSFEMSVPTVVRLTSPKIDLFSAQHPVLSFWMYQSANDATESLEVEISFNDQQFVKLGTFPVKGSETGWKEFTIEIPRILCKEQAMLTFKGISGNGNNIHLDNIRVYEKGTTDYDIDLEAVSIEPPKVIMVGDDATFTVTVYNNGSQTVSDYKVNLLCDDEIVMSTNGQEIAAGATIQYIFHGGAEESDNHKTYTFKGSVTCATDQNAANDVTPGVSITIGEDGAVDTLTGNAIKVAGGRGSLTISGAQGKRVLVTTLDGRSVASFVASAADTISLERGIYIVAIEGKNVKVIVR